MVRPMCGGHGEKSFLRRGDSGYRGGKGLRRRAVLEKGTVLRGLYSAIWEILLRGKKSRKESKKDARLQGPPLRASERRGGNASSL